jgi:hypothetical protein
VETENPSVRATVVGKLCKVTIAVYCLYLSVIKSAHVTN